MKSRTVVSAVAVLAAAALLTTGCSAGSGTSGKTTVTIMTWESAATNSAIDAALADFSDPNITVKRIETPSGDYSAKLSSLTQAKKLPDLFWCGNDTEQQYSKLGVLTDWSKTLDGGGKLTKDTFGTAIDGWTTDSGQIGGVPSLLNTYGYWYNADAFTAAGLKIPASGWTWDEFYADAKALSNKNGATFGAFAENLVNTDAPYSISVYSLSAGGKGFVDSTNNPTKAQADDKFTEGVQKLADAVQGGYVAPPGYDFSNGTSLFVGGQLPILGAGQWLAAGFLTDKPGFTYGFAPLPVVNKPATLYDAVGVCTPKETANPDATFKVLEYLDSTVWEKVLPTSPVAAPAFTDSQSAYFDALSSSGAPESIGATVKEDLGITSTIGVRLTPIWGPKVAEQVTALYLPILTGEAPISQLQDLVKKTNDLIASNK
jgi:ABC-type glycerol-3-phosphate transport system substrate-binding protein